MVINQFHDAICGALDEANSIVLFVSERVDPFCSNQMYITLPAPPDPVTTCAENSTLYVPGFATTIVSLVVVVVVKVI